MPRAPCLVCRATSSTPAKFLLQCSCGIGLHHTCIVPAIPKKTLLLMVEASTNGHRTNSLKNWQCPGCKAAEKPRKVARTIKKHDQLFPPGRSDLVSSPRVRVGDKTRKGMPQKRQFAGGELPKDSKPVKKQVKYAYPCARRSNERDTRLVPDRNPVSSSTNLPRPDFSSAKKRDSSRQRGGTATTDGRQTAQLPPSKVLAQDDDLFQSKFPPDPDFSSKEIHDKEASIPNKSSPSSTDKPTQPEVVPSLNTVPTPVNKSQEPFIAEGGINSTTVTVLLSETPQSPPPPSPPPPPMLDLRKFLKRKRSSIQNTFQRIFFTSPIDEQCVGLPAKRRRLNSQEPNSHGQRVSQPQCQLQLDEQNLVVNPSNPSPQMDVNQTMQTRSSTPTRRLTPSPDITLNLLPLRPLPHNKSQALRYDPQIQDIQTEEIASNSESTSSAAETPDAAPVAADRRRSVEGSPMQIAENGVPTAHPKSPEPDAGPSTTFTNEVSPSRVVNEPAPYPERPHLEENETHLESVGRQEIDQDSDEIIVDDSQNASNSIAISNPDCGAAKKAYQQSSFTDGLFSPPLTDTDQGVAQSTERPQLDLPRPTSSDSDFTNQGHAGKASITAPSDHSENGSAEENEVLSELDIIVKRLPQLQPRPPFKLPKVTLPVLATCFSSFKVSSKRVGAGF